MVTDKIIGQVDKEIQNIYSELENRLVYNLCKNLAKEEPSTDAAQWQWAKLRQMSSREIAEIIRDTGMKHSLVETLGAVVGGMRQAEDIERKQFEQHPTVSHPSFTQEDTRLFDNTVASVLNNIRTEVKNLVNTTAQGAVRDGWVHAVNKAFVGMQSGQMTLEQAIKDACDELGGRGVPVKYVSKNGRETTTRMDVMVRRCCVTSMTQASAALTIERCQQYETDLVEVSQHAESRPEHFEYQGNVYSISGKNKNYPPLSATGYGTIEGLCGINCRHYFFPFFEGESTQAEKLPISAEENERRYEESQKQRAFERKIREEKRQLAATRGYGTREEIRQATHKHKQTLKEYEDFLKETHRGREQEREVATNKGSHDYDVSNIQNLTERNSYGLTIDDLHPQTLGGTIRIKDSFPPEIAIKSNPRYYSGWEYETNCQSCVVAYEARRRGYNVMAKPNFLKEDSIAEKLADNKQLAWSNIFSFENKKNLLSSQEDGTPISVFNFLNETVKNNERYVLSVKLEKGSHVVNLERIDNELCIIDGQKNEISKGLNGICRFFSDVKIQYKNPKNIEFKEAGYSILRIDGLKFKTNVCNEILEGSTYRVE